jgi:opacity protein-like surface antigen
MKTTFALAAVLLLAASPALAQSWEISGLAGLTPSAPIDRRAPELDELNMQGGFTWGAQVARFFTPHLGVEALWTEQSSGLELGTSSGTATLFTSTTAQLQGSVVYQLSARNARLQPFAFFGLGSTFFDATNLPAETKLSLGVGGGVKFFPWPTVGFRGHFRYKPTMLDDEDAGDFCDPFGFCQNMLQQIEIAAGAVLRF